MKKLLIIALLFCSFGAFAQTATATLKGKVVSKAADATIVSHKWVQVSGPNQSILATPSAPETNVTGLKWGCLRF